jgi:hypothetical protein
VCRSNGLCSRGDHSRANIHKDWLGIKITDYFGGGSKGIRTGDDLFSYPRITFSAKCVAAVHGRLPLKLENFRSNSFVFGPVVSHLHEYQE